ncbi:MAG: DNA-binding response regulator [Rhodospirillales bacterium]|jgi:two-component system response regulator FixJ|nr:DNA-binding response regulator [Rhodospirillales bacterium]
MPPERLVHVVDDDNAVRRSLERLLQASGYGVRSYEGGQALLDSADSLQKGCLLLDVRMPDIDGTTLQLRLRKLGVLLPTVVMTGQGDVQTAVRAMKAGAVDFIEKPFSDEVLFRALEAALASGTQSDRERAAIDAARRIATLTSREMQVLEALVGGQSNKVIAYELGISIRTVEVHRARMMERLGVRRLAEAIRLAVMARLGASRSFASEDDRLLQAAPR